MKTCRKCGVEKPVSEFHKGKRYKGGLNARCKVCRSGNHSDNQARYSASKSVHYLANRDRIRDSISQYKSNNSGKVNALTAKRRAAKLERTPVWADHLVISMIYEDCPAGHQVDHIYPLQGDTVSGLHVPWNLQYLTASENASKGNRYVA